MNLKLLKQASHLIKQSYNLTEDDLVYNPGPNPTAENFEAIMNYFGNDAAEAANHIASIYNLDPKVTYNNLDHYNEARNIANKYEDYDKAYKNYRQQMKDGYQYGRSEIKRYNKLNPQSPLPALKAPTEQSIQNSFNKEVQDAEKNCNEHIQKIDYTWPFQN